MDQKSSHAAVPQTVVFTFSQIKEQESEGEKKGGGEKD